MHSSNFQLNKVRRIVRTQGKTFTVTREGINEFQEPDGTVESFPLIGVYHTSPSNSMYSVQHKSDSTMVWPKSFPMILCLWEEAEKLKLTDRVVLNGKMYRVGEIRNVDEANLIGDITLEEIQIIEES